MTSGRDTRAEKRTRVDRNGTAPHRRSVVAEPSDALPGEDILAAMGHSAMLSGTPQDFAKHDYMQRRAYRAHYMAELVARCELRYPDRLEELAQFFEGEAGRLLRRADMERKAKAR